MTSIWSHQYRWGLKVWRGSEHLRVTFTRMELSGWTVTRRSTGGVWTKESLHRICRLQQILGQEDKQRRGQLLVPAGGLSYEVHKQGAMGATSGFRQEEFHVNQADGNVWAPTGRSRCKLHKRQRPGSARSILIETKQGATSGFQQVDSCVN